MINGKSIYIWCVQYVLQIDGMNTKSKFNIDTAVSMLKRYVRPEDNLNTAKLVCCFPVILNCKKN